MTNLSITQLDQLKEAGYTESEIQAAMNEIEVESLQGSYGNFQNTLSNDPRQFSKISSFSSVAQQDLIKWQLELNDILERSEHILRGDIPQFKDGQIIWQANPGKEGNTLNEYGVQEIMKTLAMYVNRNTILSDYNIDEIQLKVFDFGRELNNLIFMRYDDFGMNTEEKRKNYPMLVREIVDIVHSSYNRALDGGERRSLREMISVNQTTQTPGITLNNQGQPSRERGLLNPMRLIKGKYV